MEEIVLYSSLSQSKNDSIITASDLHKGSHVRTFKTSSCPINGLQASSSYIFAAQDEKASLHVYSWQKEGVEKTVILPDKLQSLSLSPSGTWLAGGAVSGYLYLWELSSGNLIFARDVHYQRITCLEFSQDEAYLFSGSGDGRVLGWRILDIVTIGGDQNLIQPAMSWNPQSTITGLRVGYGRSMDGRVFTASGKTCQVWDINSTQLISTFIVTEMINCLEIDPVERAVYLGLQNGQVQTISLYSHNPATGMIEAVGGGGRPITITPDSSDAVINHQSPVTALAVSFDGSLIVSGDSQGQVFVWDAASKQILSKLKQHQGSSISSIQILRDIDYYKHHQHARTKDKKERGLTSFKREVKPSELHKHEIWFQIPEPLLVQNSQAGDDDLIQQTRYQLSQFSNGSAESALKAKVQLLEKDLETLYDNYCRLQSLHQELWKAHVEESKLK